MPAAGRQPQRQQQKLAFRGLAGRCRSAGTPQVRPCGNCVDGGAWPLHQHSCYMAIVEIQAYTAAHAGSRHLRCQIPIR
ncbi:hypothetical protein D7U93_03510 [Stenotrophomonas maltophilia]|nr:hypothetical protein [Stenotrophomonas maltophilia]MBA0379608.1 hypothetical protein [Stenotrophomonas maltophilia]MBA0407138.1 hypothetical protein [Stenotrophomonas maltophilia]MBA0425792.1 hypothetical protein [Stenotrophomonas maltophilia]MBA0452330.1 hypothetical protein [Stenotrophomonas maltophilia]